MNFRSKLFLAASLSALLVAAPGCKQIYQAGGGGGGKQPGGHAGGKPSGGGGTGNTGTPNPGTAVPGTDYFTDLKLTYGAAPLATQNKFATNVAYGSNPNCTFDMLMPTGPAPAPLLIFIHGGGFTQGDKGIFFKKYAPQVEQLLQAGFGVASINYRFIQNGPNGVMNSLADSRRCLQFIRYHAQELGVDKDHIGLMGTSAGAGTSLWLAMHDDMADLSASDPVARQSTRVKAVATINTQSSYDMLTWDNIFGPVYNIKPSENPRFKQEITRFYGLSSYDQVNDPKIAAMRADLDIPRLINKGDPPMWLDNDHPNARPEKQGLLLHHPLHAKTLADAATKAGVEVEATAGCITPVGRQESFVAFLERTLK
jgi:acetyl esterase/lipase